MIPAPVSNTYLAAFVAELELMPRNAQIAAFNREATETGGDFIDLTQHPVNNLNGCIELSLHGIAGAGFTIQQAIAAWQRAAVAQLQNHLQEAAE